MVPHGAICLVNKLQSVVGESVQLSLEIAEPKDVFERVNLRHLDQIARGREAEAANSKRTTTRNPSLKKWLALSSLCVIETFERDSCVIQRREWQIF